MPSKAKADAPLCMMCNQYPVAIKGGVVCRSPKCKRQLGEERRRMGAAERKRKTNERMERAKQNIMRPDKLKRDMRADIDRALSYGFTETEAVWSVARQYGVKPAEVMHAVRDRDAS